MSPQHAHPAGPGPDASVRLAAPDDAAEVGAVQAALWHEAYASLVPPEVRSAFQPDRFAGVWRESLENPPSGAYRLLLACAGGRVVGFAALGPSPDPDATALDGELLVGGVHPDERRAGHGSRLLNAAVDTATTDGFTRMRMWLPAGDTATAGFVGAAGFALDGARRRRVVGPAIEDVVAEVRLTAGTA